MIVLLMIEIRLLALKTFSTKFTFVLKIVREMDGLAVTPSLISPSEDFGADGALMASLDLLNVLIQVLRAGDVAWRYNKHSSHM